MGKINLLDDHLSNKIAAGEVVERPASVVKELVENAIDAGSTVIEIFIEEAGLKSIRIIDNGDGIAPDDVLNAFERHATSKIRDENDLFHIRTLGFRGEALPSIASVARVEVKTSTGEGMGTHLIIEGGKVLQHQGSDSRKGTDFRVEQIFYNTPARLKYLKSEATELGNITDVVNRLAISHPEISFTLRSNGRELLRTAGNGQVKQVFSAIYGLEIAKKMLSFEANSLDFKIEGLIGLPELTRASRNYMTILVNGRYIKNFMISKAILDAYHTLLPINRYPYVFINITLDPYLVDVNVHPSKMEVRLSKEKELIELITTSMKAKLQSLTLIPMGNVTNRVERANNEQQIFQFEPGQSSAKILENDYRSTKNEQVDVQQAGKEDVVAESADFTSENPFDSLKKITEWNQREQFKVNSFKSQAIDKPDHAYQIISQSEVFDEPPTNVEKVIFEESEPQSKIPPLYLIGQLHGTYLLAQNENGLYIIDQHAAQERMKYEYFKVKIGEVEREYQELLFPITLNYSTDDYIRIREQKDMLQEIGVYLEEFGGNSYIVRMIPTWFPKGEEETLLDELVNQVVTMKKVDIGKLREEAAIMMSCKGSIKANRFLRQYEMQALLDDLRRTSDPFTCPHGRPIIIQFTQYEIEKMFKRVM